MNLPSNPSNVTIQPDGTVSFRSFLTLPGFAAEVGQCDETVARELTMRGLLPDGVVQFGRRRVPIFDATRVPDLRAALGLSASV